MYIYIQYISRQILHPCIDHSLVIAKGDVLLHRHDIKLVYICTMILCNTAACLISCFPVLFTDSNDASYYRIQNTNKVKAQQCMNRQAAICTEYISCLT